MTSTQNNKMTVGGLYKFKHQKERLIYMGKNFSGNWYWHQFRKESESEVWAEMLDSDLRNIERIG